METTTIKFTPVDVKQRQGLGVRAGDTVKVWQKIQEKGKTRLQVFEGLVLSVKHGTEPGATFTVRRTSSGVGIEKIFPLYSPAIDKVEIVRRSKVRQSKLYHIRDKAAKEIRRQMRNIKILPTEEVEVGDETDIPAVSEDEDGEEAGVMDTEVITEETVEPKAETEKGEGVEGKIES